MTYLKKCNTQQNLAYLSNPFTIPFPLCNSLRKEEPHMEGLEALMARTVHTYYGLHLKWLPKPSAEGLVPNCGATGGSGTIRRWGLLGGS